MTPAASLLLELASMVSSAEKQLKDGPLYWAKSKIEDVTRNLETGQAMNSLGELQATAAGFDVAVSRLETAANAFKAAYRNLGNEQMDEGERDWLTHEIERSPRLTAIREALRS